MTENKCMNLLYSYLKHEMESLILNSERGVHQLMCDEGVNTACKEIETDASASKTIGQKNLKIYKKLRDECGIDVYTSTDSLLAS